MSEAIPQGEKPETLDDLRLYGRTLNDWHTWLVTDQENGDDDSKVACPVSRYGYYATDCAWYAIAAEYVYTRICGEDADYDGEVGMWSQMSLVVNDDQTVGEVLVDYWDELPRCLQDALGGDVKYLREAL